MKLKSTIGDTLTRSLEGWSSSRISIAAAARHTPKFPVDHPQGVLELPRARIFWFIAISTALSSANAEDAPSTSDAARDAAGNRFVTKPYLQIGRTPSVGTLQLLWHSPDSDARWSVESREAEDGPWKRARLAEPRRVSVSGIVPHRIHRAELSGLTPGVTFTYRVLDGDQVVFSALARSPKSADQKYRFVTFADCGAGTPEQKPLAHRAFLEAPDLVVIPGDMVYEEGLMSEYRDKFWPVYNADEPSEAGAPLIRSVPFVAAPGNHDTEQRNLTKFPDGLAYFLYWDQPLNGPLGQQGGPFVSPLTATETARAAFLRSTDGAFPRMTNFSFDYGNAHWTIVDSNPYVDWTDPTLKTWVAADLATAQSATWRFVAFHHPGFNSANEHLEQQHMRLLAPVLEAGKVDVVFSGHLHNYQRSFPVRFEPLKQGTLMIGGRDGKTIRGRVVPGRWRLDKTFDGQSDTTPVGVIYLVTGAGGQKLYNPEQNDDPDSWQKFTDKFHSTTHSLTVADVEGETLTVRQLAADGQELDRFRLTKPSPGAAGASR